MMVQLMGRIRQFLGGSKTLRPIYRRFPGKERCKECLAPFQGLLSLPFRLVGIKPSRKNPHLCTM